MTKKTVVSTLEVVNWFCKKAEKARIPLEESKIQNMLFLAQMHYVLKSGQLLTPSLFVCGQDGFFEPTIRTLLGFGLPLMAAPKLENETSVFLELIWQKYAPWKNDELKKFVVSLECWKNFYRPERELIVNPVSIIDSFSNSIRGVAPQPAVTGKVLMSQNGPVQVSSWKPRKVTSSNL
jgi:hypothetical protein